MDGQVTWTTDRNPPFVRGGSIPADGLRLMTDEHPTLYPNEPGPAGCMPRGRAVFLEPGGNRAPLARADGRRLVRGHQQLGALQVAR